MTVQLVYCFLCLKREIQVKYRAYMLQCRIGGLVERSCSLHADYCVSVYIAGCTYTQIPFACALSCLDTSHLQFKSIFVKPSPDRSASQHSILAQAQCHPNKVTRVFSLELAGGPLDWCAGKGSTYLRVVARYHRLTACQDWISIHVSCCLAIAYSKVLLNKIALVEQACKLLVVWVIEIILNVMKMKIEGL